MTMQGWGVKTVAGVGVFAGWFLACSGDDIPPIEDDLRGALAQNFGGASMQSGNAGSAGASSGGRGGAAAGGTGNSGSGNSGSGNAGGGAAGAGGGEPVGGGGSGVAECDAFPILQESCGLAGCHNDGAANGGFGASEELAATYVDEPSNYCDALIIDSANPEDSLLYTKLFEDFPDGCGNSQMPLTGSFLSEEDTDCVLGWLQQFAQ